jgi:hypothetical protein
LVPALWLLAEAAVHDQYLAASLKTTYARGATTARLCIARSIRRYPGMAETVGDVPHTTWSVPALWL